MSPGGPRVSVIIPTYNRADGLMRCLRSLERQSMPPGEFEVLVADDGSTDGTQESLRAFAAGSRLRVSVYTTRRKGPGAARNEAASHAGAPLLAFTEDDIVLDPAWLELGCARLESGALDGVEGLTAVGESAGPLRVLERPDHVGFLPCNLFLRSEAFRSAGGFEESFFDPASGLYFREDADLGFRLTWMGARIARAPEVLATHPPQYEDARAVFRHARRSMFDPLLYSRHPAAFRALLERKQIGPFVFHRPFHYLSLAYCVAALLAGGAAAAGYGTPALAAGAAALILHLPLRYRYERAKAPSFRMLVVTLAFLLLPFYYVYWYIRGCRKFRNWRSIV